MRAYTMFHKGDTVTPQNELELFARINENINLPAKLVIAEAKIHDEASHVYLNVCDRPSLCIHTCGHPQLVKLEGCENWFSGYWFDPIKQHV